MEVVKVLEEKVKSLVVLARELKKNNMSLDTKINKLQNQIEELEKKNKEVKAENSLLAEENTELALKFNTVQGSAQKGAQTIDKLSQEQELAKIVIDDLIKSINTLVEIEKQ